MSKNRITLAALAMALAGGTSADTGTYKFDATPRNVRPWSPYSSPACGIPPCANPAWRRRSGMAQSYCVTIGYRRDDDGKRLTVCRHINTRHHYQSKASRA
jgi:putative hemolysin